MSNKVKVCLDAGHVGSKYNQSPVVKTYYESAMVWSLHLKLKAALGEMGVPFLVDSPSNQQFPILPDAVLKAIEREFSYSYQQRMDARNSCVRFCTSWATREADVDALIAAIRAAF